MGTAFVAVDTRDADDAAVAELVDVTEGELPTVTDVVWDAHSDEDADADGDGAIE